jgi:hypothetical protein
LGDSTPESQKASLSAGRSAAFRFRAGISGITGVAQLYVDSLTTASTVIVGIYADQNHHPGALLSTGSVSALRDGAWNELALSAGSLTAGSQYWLAVLPIDGTLHYRDRSRGSCKSETSAQANLSSLPTTWSAGSAASGLTGGTDSADLTGSPHGTNTPHRTYPSTSDAPHSELHLLPNRAGARAVRHVRRRELDLPERSVHL